MIRSRVRPMVVSTVLAAGLVAGGGVAATAVIDYVGGGTWQHGNNDITVWSYYQHLTLCHGSSVQGEKFVTDQEPAGNWSMASTGARWWTKDYSYWRLC